MTTSRCSTVSIALKGQWLRVEYYLISADGLLMPAKKDQAPPDLRYFNPSKK
jgi:hypothetical protein